MKSLAVGGLLAGFLSLPTWAGADCALPPAPDHLPNGATATREEMVAAMQAIQDYEAAVRAFSKCADGSRSEALRQNADRAVDKVRFIADKFNGELQTFKKRNVT
jgi:hypothetical protein